MRSPTAFLPWLLVIGSCGSPPRPPEVDESSRRPVNSAQALELVTCQNQLHNAQIAAREGGRRAEYSAAHLGALTARQLMLGAAMPVAGSAPKSALPQANQIFTAHFAFGSTRLDLPSDTGAALAEQARRAPLILLRGRTDGNVETASESRVARERAATVRDYLVAAGVDPLRIRTTYQPVGDHAAENLSTEGRASNRRVEVELYRTTPLPLPVRPASGD